MLTVEDYGQVRRAHRDGMSIREIARTFHHSRRKVREALASPEPEPYTRAKDPPAPKLGAFHATIEAILEADEQAPRKQRHTAAQIFRRLRDEHEYAGGYDQVRRYVGRHRREQRETFIPLTHDPGQRLECDFGHIYADFPNGRRQVPVLMPTWAYSNPAGFAYCPFAVALPTERVEAILHGMVEAFAFFGCVPREVWWDNPKTVDPRWDRVVIRIFKGPAANAPRTLRGPGQPLHVRAAMLHARTREREAAHRESRLRSPTALGHAGAVRARPGRAEHLSAHLLSEGP